MAALKAVTFEYEPLDAVKPLLDTFRMMVNHAIWIGKRQGISGRFRLITAVYDEFKRYELHTHYTLSACEVASAILKNSKWKHRSPVAKKRFLKLDTQIYRIWNNTVRIPVKPRHFITLKIKLGEYQRKFLEDTSLKRGSITLTESKLILAVEKMKSTQYAYSSMLAYDTNEFSLDGILSNRSELGVIHTDLHKVARIQSTHFDRRRRLQSRLAHCQRKLTAKLADDRDRERRRVAAVLHRVAKEQVRVADENAAKIVLEDLKGIRRTVNRRVRKMNPHNGKLHAISSHGKALKRRLNRCPFRRLQSFIEYKAKWTGVPLTYVPAWNTSRTCAMCGCLRTGHRGEQDPNTRRIFRCPSCGWRCDRHMDAALNLLKTQDEGRWFSPDRLPNEVMTAKRAYGEKAKPKIFRDLTGPINLSG